MLPIEARTRIADLDTKDFVELGPALPSQMAGEYGEIIRIAQLSDLDRLMEIERACFPGLAAYKRSQLEYLAFRAHSTCLVDTLDGIVAGMVIVLYRRGARVAGVEVLDVDPAYQGRGIGARLLAAAEGDMGQRGVLRSRLEVASGDSYAVRFYQRVGYRAVKALPSYYVHERYGSKDAMRMVKELSGSQSAPIMGKQSLYNHPRLI